MKGTLSHKFWYGVKLPWLRNYITLGHEKWTEILYRKYGIVLHSEAICPHMKQTFQSVFLKYKFFSRNGFIVLVVHCCSPAWGQPKGSCSPQDSITSHQRVLDRTGHELSHGSQGKKSAEMVTAEENQGKAFSPTPMFIKTILEHLPGFLFPRRKHVCI